MLASHLLAACFCTMIMIGRSSVHHAGYAVSVSTNLERGEREVVDVVGEEARAGGRVRADGAEERLGPRGLEVVQEALQDLMRLLVCRLSFFGDGWLFGSGPVHAATHPDGLGSRVEAGARKLPEPGGVVGKVGVDPVDAGGQQREAVSHLSFFFVFGGMVAIDRSID